MRFVHGHNCIKHGHDKVGKRTKEYRAWDSMIARCYRSSQVSYKNYGARGIRVCKRWLDSFPAFLSDMGLKPSPTHSLDRIDGNGNYEPSNCRWATGREQALNKRPHRKNAPNTHGKFICFDKAQGKFIVRVSLLGQRKQKYIGRFSSKTEAAEAARLEVIRQEKSNAGRICTRK